MAASLTTVERHKLNDLESIISKGLQTFVEVGASLAQIREQRLYRQDFDTFEAYCQERWGWTRRRANQLIESHAIVDSLGEVGKILPSESHAQALKHVPPEQRATVLEEARADASAEGKRVTAERIRDTAHKYTPANEQQRRAATEGSRELNPTRLPPQKQPKPRPQIAHVMAVVRAATSLGSVSDEQIRAVPFNAIMGQRLQEARDVIDRIISYHDRSNAT